MDIDGTGSTGGKAGEGAAGTKRKLDDGSTTNGIANVDSGNSNPHPHSPESPPYKKKKSLKLRLSLSGSGSKKIKVLDTASPGQPVPDLKSPPPPPPPGIKEEPPSSAIAEAHHEPTEPSEPRPPPPPPPRRPPSPPPPPPRPPASAAPRPDAVPAGTSATTATKTSNKQFSSKSSSSSRRIKLSLPKTSASSGEAASKTNVSAGSSVGSGGEAAKKVQRRTSSTGRSGGSGKNSFGNSNFGTDAPRALANATILPMTSPGLLVVGAGKNNLVPPRVIFDQTMASVGYTADSRTKNPHRGSSVKLVVGDMYDSTTTTRLHFPKLVPNAFLKRVDIASAPTASGTQQQQQQPQVPQQQTSSAEKSSPSSSTPDQPQTGSGEGKAATGAEIATSTPTTTLESETAAVDVSSKKDRNLDTVGTKGTSSNLNSSLINGVGSIAEKQEEKESPSLDVVMKDDAEEKTIIGHVQDESRVKPLIKTEQDDNDDKRMDDKADAVSQSNNDGQASGVQGTIVKEEEKDNSGGVPPPSAHQREEMQHEQKKPMATEGADVSTYPDEKHPTETKSLAENKDVTKSDGHIGALASPTKPHRSEKKPSLADRLIKSFGKRAVGSSKLSSTNSNLNPLRPFAGMIPLSLTVPYPDDYLLRQAKYLREVKQREKAIVAAQEATDAIEIEREAAEMLGKPYTGPRESNIVVPPIPHPPRPPGIKEMKKLDPAIFGRNAEERLYPLKDTKNEHLDPHCFHITQGRYFGLECNHTFDPTWNGPNCLGTLFVFSALTI